MHSRNVNAQRIRSDRFVKLMIKGIQDALDHHGNKEDVYFSWIHGGNGIPDGALAVKIQSNSQISLTIRHAQSAWSKMDNSNCSPATNYEVSVEIRLGRIDKEASLLAQDRIGTPFHFKLIRANVDESKVK